jgi:hypothetical protein
MHSSLNEKIKTQQLVNRAIITLSLLMLTSHASIAAQLTFKRIPLQFIAALGDPDATSGSDAQSWGLWPVDPGPRGVRLSHYDKLQAADGIAPSKWQFDSTDWWVEENGLIMEKPYFPLAPGKYLVTGDREVTTVLTIHPKDQDGARRWELDNGAKLYDVTHLPCRSARYTPATTANSCSPARMQDTVFPITPGATMPAVEGCNKQDYAVLFVIGVEVKN